MRLPHRAALLLAAMTAAVPAIALPALTAPADAAAAYPYYTSPNDPPGANDWSCRPTAAHPVPVVIVHGTFGDRTHLWESMSFRLSQAGYCVYSLDYGNRGTGPIEDSAQQLADFTARVLESTGASKVSMIGHSQGGMMPRYYIKFLGGDQVVEDLVGVAPSNHGGTSGTSGINLDNPISALFGQFCMACLQQNPGSEFLTELNAGDQTPGDISYTQITTKYDELVRPHTLGYLAPGPNTTNLTIQDICRLDLSEHVLIPSSLTTIAITLEALTRPGPARADFPRRC